MALEPWKVMAGLAVLLVVIGLVTQLSRFEPVDIFIVFLMIASILAAMYLGWQIGQRFGDE